MELWEQRDNGGEDTNLKSFCAFRSIAGSTMDLCFSVMVER